MIIDGKSLATEYLSQLRNDFKNLDHRCKIALLYFENISATHLYIKNIKKVASEFDIDILDKVFQCESEQKDIIEFVSGLSKDDSIDFIFFSSEVPNHIDFNEIVKNIDYKKDVDCATPHNLGLFYMGKGVVAPCTANAVINILKMQFCESFIRGKNCTVIGRNNSVGKPISTLLLNNDGTVSICHSATRDLVKYTKTADILVVAVGIKDFIRKEMVKEDVVIIDVGINFDENGKICGDTSFEELEGYVSAITPVPGGLGQMTVAMFFTNCINLLHLK